MNTTADLHELEGRVVLVCSAWDQHNPPTGLRGTIRVPDAEGSARPRIEVELDFPQMFVTRAHHRTVVLSDDEVSELLASEDCGGFTVFLRGRLDPQAPVGSE